VKSKAIVLTISILCGGMFLLHLMSRSHVNTSLSGDLAVPENLRPIITRACRDCHTDQTHWPWYSRLPGVSFVIEHDVRKGKEHLNFSTWSMNSKGKPTRNQLQEVCDAVSDNAMPPRSYRFMHPKSRLSDREVDALCQWSDIASNLASPPQETNP
jgi:Haem-binding domain